MIWHRSSAQLTQFPVGKELFVQIYFDKLCRDLDSNNTKGAENFFWVHPMFHTIFENKSVTAMEIYTNMSYQLGVDINMFLYHWIPEYVYF